MDATSDGEPPKTFGFQVSLGHVLVDGAEGPNHVLTGGYRSE